jgi:hypothetical protein
LILLLASGLLFISPNQALAQETNGNDKIDAISKRLEELEKQVKELKRENSELKTRLDGKETPKALLATETKTPADETREVTDAQQSSEPQNKDKRIEVGGEIRLRGEFVDHNLNTFGFASDLLIRQRARLHVKAKLTDDITGFVQIQDSRIWGEEFSTSSDLSNVDLHQAYIDMNHFLTKPLSLRIGRQELSYGDERLIGAFDWNNDGRSFDAVKAVYARKKWSADIFAARIQDEEFFFFDSFYQDFYGTYLKLFNDNPNRKLEFYGLVLKDNFFLNGEFGRDRSEPTTIYTIGTRQEAKTDSGFYYDGELALQTGHRGPDNHRALALAARVGKYFESARSLHLGFEFDLATGDKNAGDGKSNEFIDLFPDNHIHYGYMDLLGWRNMVDYRVNVGFNPISKLAFDADYHKFFLHREGGRWSDANGRTNGFDPFGLSGKNLGQELDFTLAFPYKERIKLLTGYSVFFPGRFVQRLRGRDLSHFSYVQMLIGF